jgi:hypothetical protein
MEGSERRKGPLRLGNPWECRCASVRRMVLHLMND